MALQEALAGSSELITNSTGTDFVAPGCLAYSSTDVGQKRHLLIQCCFLSNFLGKHFGVDRRSIYDIGPKLVESLKLRLRLGLNSSPYPDSIPAFLLSLGGSHCTKEAPLG